VLSTVAYEWSTVKISGTKSAARKSTHGTREVRGIEICVAKDKHNTKVMRAESLLTKYLGTKCQKENVTKEVKMPPKYDQ